MSDSNVNLGPVVSPNYTNTGGQIGTAGAKTGSSDVSGTNVNFTKDTITNQQTYDQQNNLTYTGSTLDNINSDNPSLMKPSGQGTTAAGSPAAGAASPGGQANPFFGANPLAEFNVTYAALTDVLNQLQLQQGLMAAVTVDLMNSNAEQQAKLILQIGQNEAIGDIVEGLVSVATALTSILGPKGGATEAEQARSNMVNQAIGQLFGAVGSFIKAGLAIQKAGLEANKVMVDNLAKLFDRRLQSFDSARSQENQQIDQLQQALLQIAAAYLASVKFQ